MPLRLNNGMVRSVHRMEVNIGTSLVSPHSAEYERHTNQSSAIFLFFIVYSHTLHASNPPIYGFPWIFLILQHFFFLFFSRQPGNTKTMWKRIRKRNQNWIWISQQQQIVCIEYALTAICVLSNGDRPSKSNRHPQHVPQQWRRQHKDNGAIDHDTRWNCE